MNTDDTSIIWRGEGTDTIWNIIQDGYVRPVVHNGLLHVSMIDTIHVFNPNSKNPRQYWKDHKRALLSQNWGEKIKVPDPELVANLYQLKLTAADGKLRLTDVGSLWLFFYVGGRLNQPFYKHMTKVYSLVQLRYRLNNIAMGKEWAAEYVHSQMKNLDPPEHLSAREEQGYLP